MSTFDLLDVFGGRDNLVLMCEARDFYASEERMFIRFEVGGKVVVLFPIYGGKYGFLVYHLATFKEVADEHAENGAGVREIFERYTGYSLSF